MLIPVFTVYATQLTAASSALIGIALGCYGLSQGVLQIPFGMLSDRFGRKPMITLGLILFAVGSLVGAFTTSIYGMIVARTLQGTGAIGSVLIALLADLTPDTQRTKAMAVIGMTIGLSFCLSMVISPAITHVFGLSGIFYLTAILACAGLLLLHFVIPTPKKEPFHVDSEVNPRQFKTVLANVHLQRLNLGIFCQHFILTATFFTVPLLLQTQLKAGHLGQQWHFYLPLMLGSFLAMLPFLTLSERKGQVKSVFLVSIVVTVVCQGLLALTYDVWPALYSLLFIYFIGFNFLEASLPSLISRQAHADSKGTAMGIYSSCQFLGIFAGGVIAGLLYQQVGSQGIFLANAGMALLWFLVAFRMKPLVYQMTLVLPLNGKSLRPEVQQQLLALPGVLQVVVADEEQTVYLRVNKETYMPDRIHALLDID